MKESLDAVLFDLFKTKSIENREVIQTLWSGYGTIERLHLNGGSVDTVIVKCINLPTTLNHPRGWNSNRSHVRKIKSYQVEANWYSKWAKICAKDCRMPNCSYQLSIENNQLFVLEDMDAAGFPLRRDSLNKTEAKLGLNWLANFHATFLNTSPTALWEDGTYWHLATRPDEWAAMKDGVLKEEAIRIDQLLSSCQFKTIIHGDAKVANFCFSEDLQKAAALDFQYVGGGCGMKDVVYFLGSCLSSKECELYEVELLDYYFNELKNALATKNKTLEFGSLEKEWRRMYSIAWADFIRFLLGWMPTHQKINDYSIKMVEQAVETLKHI